MFKKIR